MPIQTAVLCQESLLLAMHPMPSFNVVAAARTVIVVNISRYIEYYYRPASLAYRLPGQPQSEAAQAHVKEQPCKSLLS
jgi:hypothetical protein